MEVRIAVLAVATLVLGCRDGERWSREDWLQTLGRAEKRLPPPPAAMKELSCMTDTPSGTCFLDAEERLVRHALLLDALRVQWIWTGELCEQIAARTRRANWPALAEECAKVRSYYFNRLRGSGPLDDAALVEVSDRDGVAEYARFVAMLGNRLGRVPESDWHKELRVAASRREASAPRLRYPLPPPGCTPDDAVSAEGRRRGCMLPPHQRQKHRTQIVANYLHTWIPGLWSACEARVATTPRKDLPALASTCLDLRDHVTRLATSGIRLTDFGLIECKSLSLDTRDWPSLVETTLAGRDAASPVKNPCEDPSIEGSP